MTTEYGFNFGFTPSLTGFLNMEIDRMMMKRGDYRETSVRFYTWSSPTISFGLNQKPVRRLKIDKCLEDGIDIVARPTGGREILHGWDLCCSVIQSAGEDKGKVQFGPLFERVNEIFRRGLAAIGVENARYHSVTRKSGHNEGPCFSQLDRGEISIEGMKIIASAQRINAGTVLQQSSISIKRPPFEITDYLDLRNAAGSSVGIVNSAAYLEDVLDETFSIPRIVEVFKGAFETAMGKSRDLILPEIF